MADVHVTADVSDPPAWEEVVQQVVAELGSVDIAHLNAGVDLDQANLDEIPLDRYRRIMSINVDGVVFGMRALFPVMEKAGGGVVVVTASLGGLVGMPTDPIYSMTKHAMVGLVRSLGPSMSARGIRVQAVCPGIVETPLVGEERIGLLREYGFPLLQADDVAEAVARAIQSGGSGECWFVQPGRESQPFEFRHVPGPRVEGGEPGSLPDPLTVTRPT